MALVPVRCGNCRRNVWVQEPKDLVREGWGWVALGNGKAEMFACQYCVGDVDSQESDALQEQAGHEEALAEGYDSETIQRLDKLTYNLLCQRRLTDYGYHHLTLAIAILNCTQVFPGLVWGYEPVRMRQAAPEAYEAL